MPTYKITFTYNANTSEKQINTIKARNRINQMGITGVQVIIQGNKYTFTFTFIDFAPTVKEAEEEIILDIYQHFMHEIEDAPHDRSIIDPLNWIIEDIDIIDITSDRTVEIL